MLKGKESNHYTEEFKWKVVQEVLSGKYSKEEARLVYGIRSNCAILYWMRKFSGNDDYRNPRSKIKDLTSMKRSKEYEQMQARIRQLEQEVYQANLRADLWEKMIEVAEAQLELDIKKSMEPNY